MRIIVIYTDPQFSNPITYTFNLMLSILGIEHEVLPYSELTASGVDDSNLLISYGCKKIDLNADYQIQIYQSEKLFGRDYKTLSSMPQLPLKRWNRLPVIYEGNEYLESLVVQSENLIETNIDLIASSFFMLSRYEEIVVDEKDQYDRFPATASIAYKESFLSRPIVNEYIDLLWKWIDSFNLGFKRKRLWNGKDFAVCLTHDVDNLRKYRWYQELRIFGSLLLKHRQPSKAFKRVLDCAPCFLKIRSDPYWTFDYIVNLEQKYGMKSSFYFMAGGNTNFDNYYSIKSPKVIDLIRKLEVMEHEVGLHGSFDSYNDFEMLASEKAELDRIVSNKQYGGRQHYLRWKTPNTWRILEQAGLKYDATLSFADHEGFRCGICLPYKPCDVLEDRALDIWELPLSIMEGTLQKYRGLSSKEAWESIKGLLDVVSKHHGLFVLLWHNSFLDELDIPDWKRLYERLIDYVGSKFIFGGNGRDIVEWSEVNFRNTILLGK